MNTKELVVHKHFKMGRGLYRFIGLWSSPDKGVLETHPETYNLAMKSKPECCRFFCDHCGMPITHHFMIQDEDGNRFCVGSSCIEKLNDTELTTAVKQAEKDRQRALRRAQNERKREGQRLQREAKLQDQRERNGGLTDYEMREEKTRQAAEKEKWLRREAAHDVLNSLRGKGPFAEDMIRSILQGELPRGNARTICIEIMAKEHGRKNSKAYLLAYPECEARYCAMEEKIHRVDKG